MSGDKSSLPRIYREPSRNIRDTGDLFLDAFIPRASDAPLDAPQTSITEEPTTCTKINLLWLPHILGALEVLTQRDIWTGDNTEYLRIKQEIETLFNTLSNGLLCGEGDTVKLRQNSTNKFLLEISYDGGLTWATAFDYSKVYKANSYTTIYENNSYISTTQNTYNTNNTTYNNNTVNIAPNMIYGGGLSSANQDKVMCFALDTLLEAICASMAQLKIDEVNDQKSLASIVGSVMNGLSATGGTALGLGITSIGGITLSPWLIIGLALGGIGASIGGAIMTPDVSLYTNETIRDEIKCVAYNYLKGQTPTQARFKVCLDTATFSGDSLVLKNLIRNYFQSTDIYVQFMKLCNELYNVASSLPACPCASTGQTWSHLLDFTQGANGFVPMKLLNDPPTRAEYVAGFGFRRNATWAGRLAIVSSASYTTIIKRHDITFSRQNVVLGTGTGAGVDIRTFQTDLNSNSTQNLETIFTAGQTIVNFSRSVNWNLTNRRISFNSGLSASQTSPAFPSDFYLQSWYFEGEGVNPFI